MQREAMKIIQNEGKDETDEINSKEVKKQQTFLLITLRNRSFVRIRDGLKRDREQEKR